MDDKLIIEYIKSENENDFIDFKLDIYNWKNDKSKSDFLMDVINMANSNHIGDKFIITGLKVNSDGSRYYKGIDISLALDSAVYQDIVSQNVNPEFGVDFKIISYDNLQYGVFKIYNCEDRPYISKKKFLNVEKGYIKYRLGSRNTEISRDFLDNVYKSKKKQSIFKIGSYKDGKVKDYAELNKFDLIHKSDEFIEEIYRMIQDINEIKIDDCDKKVSPLLSQPVSIGETMSEKIKFTAKSLKIKLDDDFFDVGNSVSVLSGSVNRYGGLSYTLSGSDKSVDKYQKINNLSEKIDKFMAWCSFYKKTENLNYVSLAIKEMGEVDDKNINVILKIEKGKFVKNSEICDVDLIIDYDFENKYKDKIITANYNNLEISTSRLKFNNYYEYDLSYNDYQDILEFTISDIKLDEIMSFPCNIFINGNIKKIEYVITSDKNEKIQSGVIVVK